MALLSLIILPLVSAQLLPSQDSNINHLFSPAQTLPPSFLPPDSALPIADSHPALVRRQSSSCAASYTTCQSNLCCQPNTHCTTDFAGHPACCPNNAVCAGTISGASASTPSSTSQAGGGALVTTTAIALPTTSPLSSSTATATVTVTVPYAAPSIATVTAGALTGTVPNAPFAWSYIPRSFANAGECSSYYSGCQSTLSSCTAALGGAGAGVTVVGVGVTTAQVAANPTSAASVCSSLSTVACGGLQENLCGQYGGTNEGGERRRSTVGVLLGAVLGVVGGWVV